jgi:phage terminase large subunit
MSITFPELRSQILFLGIDDPEKLKSISGITSIWVEEATELSSDDWTQVDLRLRGKTKNYKQIILTFNPVSANHWIKKRFFDSQIKSKIVQSTYKDNRFIDSEYKQVLEHLKDEDEEYYKIYARGEWGTHGNFIYSNWTILKDVPDMDEIIYGLDFGYNNPSACLKIGIKDGEYYIFDEIYRTHLTNSDLIELLKPFAGKGTIYADSAEPNRIEEIQRAGFNIFPADKDVKDGIDFVKRQKLLVDPKCANTLKEIEGYKWKQDKDGNSLDEPVKFADHAMDAMRYAIYTHSKGANSEIVLKKYEVNYEDY